MDAETLTRRQYGVISTQQALACGLTKRAVACRLESGRWKPLGRGLYLAIDEATWWSRASAALLRAGPGSALALMSAAYVHGLVDKPPLVLAVAVPAYRRPLRLPGSRFRRVRRIDAVRRGRLSVTSPAQTVIDLADEPGNWGDAVNLVARAVRRRLVTREELVAELSARRAHRHRRALMLLLDVVGAGAETAAEVDYVRLVERRHGLPSARLQVVGGGPGSRIRRDAVYEEWGVVVEIDGSYHDDPGQRQSDIVRDRQTAGQGLLTLRTGNVEVAMASCEVASDVWQTLSARGCTDEVHGCGPRCALGRMLLRGGAG